MEVAQLLGLWESGSAECVGMPADLGAGTMVLVESSSSLWYVVLKGPSLMLTASGTLRATLSGVFVGPLLVVEYGGEATVMAPPL